MLMVDFKRTTEIDWGKVIMEDPLLSYDFNGGELMCLPKSFATRRKRDESGKFVDSAMTLPPVSVSWLPLDSFETVEDVRNKSTAYLLEVYGPS